MSKKEFFDYDEVFVIIWDDTTGEGTEIIDQHFYWECPKNVIADHDANVAFNTACEIMKGMNNMNLLHGTRYEVTWQRRFVNDDDIEIIVESIVEISPRKILKNY